MELYSSNVSLADKYQCASASYLVKALRQLDIPERAKCGRTEHSLALDRGVDVDRFKRCFEQTLAD